MVTLIAFAFKMPLWKNMLQVEVNLRDRRVISKALVIIRETEFPSGCSVAFGIALVSQAELVAHRDCLRQ